MRWQLKGDTLVLERDDALRQRADAVHREAVDPSIIDDFEDVPS